MRGPAGTSSTMAYFVRRDGPSCQPPLCISSCHGVLFLKLPFAGAAPPFVCDCVAQIPPSASPCLAPAFHFHVIAHVAHCLVGAQYSIEIQKYGNTDPIYVFYLASVRIIGFPRVN